MRLLSSAILLLAAAQPALAQGSQAPTLTLDEAISIARQNNPGLGLAQDARLRSAAQLRTARGAYLPSVDASFGAGFREGRQQSFGGTSFGNSSNTVSSSYSLGASARYNAATFMGPKQARANADATEADITATDQTLRATVTQQYILVLQDQATLALQDSLIANATAQLDLAKARQAAGAATALDVQRAEVQLGQQQVAALRARNALETDRLRLFQTMGIAPTTDARLTTTFAVEQPSVSLQQVLDMGRKANPQLLAARAREEAAVVGVRSAKSDYTPTLGLRADVGGYTNKVTNETGLTADQVARNHDWPFSFTRDPYTLNASLSIPIFNGFQRERNVQEAQAGRNDARFSVRREELRLDADVTSAYLTLTTDFRAITIQEQNARTARAALSLAEERYRVGLNSFLDVTQARADFVRAETDRINAIYEYHRAFAALESAVGRPLR